jgi:acetyl-CoA acyltransferase
MQNAYLALGVRTPFAKAGMDLKNTHAADLGKHALTELIARSNIPLKEWGKIVDEVIVGNTGTPSDAVNIARVIALRAGLPEHISAYTVHRNCASALESVAQAALKVQSGDCDVVVAGGTESMSNMPLLYNKKATSFFERLNRARSMQDRLKVLATAPLPEFLKPRIAIMEGLTDPFYKINMGETAEILAKEFKISREEQDQFALRSHQKTILAQKEGRFKEEIASMPIPPDFKNMLEKDVGPREEQSMEALAKLKPFFDRKFGSITAGNSCPITDGAVMLLVVNDDGLKKLGGAVKPMAKISSWAFAGLDPQRMGLGPVFATEKLLKKSNTKLADFDIVELNEAFAAQVIACQKAFDSDEFCQKHFGHGKIGNLEESRLNPKGGAIALGHPVGATGARLVLTLALELQHQNKNRGLATLCIGGGQGGALSLESI